MGKRTLRAGTVILSLFAAAISVPARSPAIQLTGEMTRFRTLPGKWTCASTISAPNSPKERITMAMAFDVIAGNVLHDHLSSGDFDAHLYYGYSAARKHFWAVTANSDGTQLKQTSAEGMYFEGSIVQNTKVRISDAFRFSDYLHFRVHDLTTLSNGAVITTDRSCVRRR